MESLALALPGVDQRPPEGEGEKVRERRVRERRVRERRVRERTVRERTVREIDDRDDERDCSR